MKQGLCVMGPVTAFWVMIFVMVGGVVIQSVESKKFESAVYIAENGLHCFMCSRGLKVKADCIVDNTQSSCERCPNGTYQDENTRNNTCKMCTRCDGNEEMYSNCTAIKDALCRCKAGYGSFTDDTENSSSRCFECPVGDWLNSTTGARHCKPGCWPPVTERDGSSGECKQCANCTSGNLPPALNCTTMSDAQCPSRLSPGIIALITIVISVIVFGLVFTVYCCYKHRNSSITGCAGDRTQKQLENLSCGRQDPERAALKITPQLRRVQTHPYLEDCLRTAVVQCGGYSLCQSWPPICAIAA